MIGKTVKIIPSAALKDMKLKSIIGREGVIVAQGTHNKGVYVKLYQPYMNEEEWFIPNKSIQIISR